MFVSWASSRPPPSLTFRSLQRPATRTPNSSSLDTKSNLDSNNFMMRCAGAVNTTKALVRLELHYCLSAVLETMALEDGRPDAAAKIVLQVRSAPTCTTLPQWCLRTFSFATHHFATACFKLPSFSLQMS